MTAFIPPSKVYRIVSTITITTASRSDVPSNTHALCDGSCNQKGSRRHRPHLLAKSFLDQRIRGEEFPAKVTGQKQKDNEYSPDQIPENKLQKCQVPAIRNRRRPNNRQRRSLRSHNRKRQRPPRRRPSTQKIIAGVLRPPPEMHPQRR